MKVAGANMKDYVKADTCRRKVLLKHFDGELPTNLPTGHKCCDACACSRVL